MNAEQSLPLSAHSPADSGEAGALSRHTAIAVLVLGLCITAVAWWESMVREQGLIEQAFAARTRALTEHLRVRMLEQQLILRGTLGMIASTGRIPTRHEWQLYVESLNLPRDNTGLAGIGLAVHDFSGKTRGNAAKPAALIPDDTALLSAAHMARMVAAYIEPMSEENQRGLGQNLAAEPVLLAAMQRARDSGEAVVSGRIARSALPGWHADLAIVVPVYAPGRDSQTIADRRAALLGYAYSPIHARDWLGGILRSRPEDLLQFEIEVHDSAMPDSPAGLLYDNKENRATPSVRRTLQYVEMPGAQWTVQVSSRPAFEELHYSRTPALVALGGIVLSLLIAGLVLLMARQREWARAQAREMTRELRDHRNKLEIENTIARLLSDATTVDEALAEVLKQLATAYGWDCGAFWQVADNGRLLRCASAWTQGDAALNAFYARHQEMPVHSSGNGVARRVWKTDAPCWIPDVQSCGGTVRAEGFALAGIRSGAAFPINAGKEKIGVIELFSRHTIEPQDLVLAALSSFGAQIAQFCKRKQAEHDLWQTATHDALTGLPNRSMFNDALAQGFARARRRRNRIAVMFVDLDRFKTINDTLGHEAGDAMLIGIAQRLRRVTREVDLVARLGGDEFVLMIEDFARNDELGQIADRILRELDAPINCAGHLLHATASIGISISPDDGEEMATTLKCADIAMYRAKEEGRNQFRFYAAAMSAHTVERLSLENNLREAIVREEFLLHYQPKAELASGRIAGVEALIRWKSPRRGMVPPGDFIPLAEETGLILPIGRWALQTACRQGRAWQLEGLPGMRIAVNLSAYQLTPDLPAEVSAALTDAQLDPEWLEIEVTESMVMRNPEQSARILDSLRALGVHIAMDDFGCGYSSLGALKRLPIDSLKVDRSLVSDLPDDAGDNAICRAIVAMAHALQLRVVAEGVETEAQREFLRGLQCDEMQGYLLSRPLPAADAAAFIRAADSQRLRLVHSR